MKLRGAAHLHYAVSAAEVCAAGLRRELPDRETDAAYEKTNTQEVAAFPAAAGD